MLENNGYAATFGSPTKDPYLAKTLPSKGALLKKYYGIGHYSNDNYAAFISGQPPNSDNQLDCLTSGFANFPSGDGQKGGIQQGSGLRLPCRGAPRCPISSRRRGSPGRATKRTWATIRSRDGGITCGHPKLGAKDPTTAAEKSDGYTTRHNPFMYFHSIIDNTTTCNKDVVPMGSTTGKMPTGTPKGATGLVTDLKSVATTPNFSFITPNLCDDGHDYPCTNTTGAGQGGGSSVGDINKWLSTWVPIIQASAAYKDNGLIEITFDEAEEPKLDTTACCGETKGPAADSGGNGISGPGGGVVGAVLLSPFIKAGTVVTKSLNHYSSLASIEDLFGLGPAG